MHIICVLLSICIEILVRFTQYIRVRISFALIVALRLLINNFIPFIICNAIKFWVNAMLKDFDFFEYKFIVFSFYLSIHHRYKIYNAFAYEHLYHICSDGPSYNIPINVCMQFNSFKFHAVMSWCWFCSECFVWKEVAEWQPWTAPNRQTILNCISTKINSSSR